MEAADVLLNAAKSFFPYACDMTTEKPFATPMIKPVITKEKVAKFPTAATAVSPSLFPMITKSANE